MKNGFSGKRPGHCCSRSQSQKSHDKQTFYDKTGEIPCGHAFHITAAIGTAICLQKNRKNVKGTVKFLFQPAEESAVGALKILQTDVMQDVDRAWGFHVSSMSDTGVLGISAGYVAAAVDKFLVTITGTGSPAVKNDADMAALAAGVGEAAGYDVVPEGKVMSGDDFSFYQNNCPCCYIRIGTGRGPAIHQPGVQVDPDALLPTVRYLAELMMESAVS